MSDIDLSKALKPGIGNRDGEKTSIRHSYVGSKGDLRVELHYDDFHTGHGRQAALYIYRFDKHSEGVYVPLSSMWMYAEKESLHLMIPVLAKQLYGFVTQMDQMRVLDAVLDYLDDLRKSPPEPGFLRDRSLAAFIKSCEDEGLEFFAEKNGKRIIN